MFVVPPKGQPLYHNNATEREDTHRIWPTTARRFLNENAGWYLVVVSAGNICQGFGSLFPNFQRLYAFCAMKEVAKAELPIHSNVYY